MLIYHTSIHKNDNVGFFYSETCNLLCSNELNEIGISMSLLDAGGPVSKATRIDDIKPGSNVVNKLSNLNEVNQFQMRSFS